MGDRRISSRRLVRRLADVRLGPECSVVCLRPAAVVVEEVAGFWLKELLKLPLSASFAFVSGCQMAHVTCLAAARHVLLAQRNWDVEKRGLAASPDIGVLAFNRHGSIERAIRLLGIGEENVVDLPLDATERITAATLEL